MRSIPRALMWETFSHGRWWILGLFMAGNLLPMFIYSALGPFEVDPNATEIVLMHIVFLPLIIVSFGGGNMAGQGPMSRLYTKPISTASLVAWHMFPAGILLAIELAVAGWMYRSMYQISWPILGPSLFSIAAWASLQVLTSVSHKTTTSFTLAFSPSFILFAWLHSRYGGWFKPPTHYWTDVTPLEITTLTGVTAIAYFVTVAAIERDRCGEPMPSLGGWKWIVRTWESFGAKSPISVRPFQSPKEAHFWYEWRLKGWAMPLIVILGYAVVASVGCIQIIVGEYVGNAVKDFHEANLAGGAMIPFVAGFVGLWIGIASTGSSNRYHSPTISDLFDQKNAEEMGHFLSTRPFTNSDFAKTFLRMTVRSLLITWTIWATTFVAWLFFADIMHRLPEAVFPGPIGAWYLPLILLGSWITMANLSTVGLSGRGTRLTLAIAAGFFVYPAAMVLVKAQCSESTQQILFYASIWIVSLAVLIVTPFAMFKAVQRGLLKSKNLRILLMIAAGIALIVFVVEAKTLPILAYPMIMAFSALCILPFATIPLAISWNRHR